MKTFVPRSLLLLVALVIALPRMPVHAQELTADELELVQLVQHSYENLQALQSYHTDGTTNAFQTITADFGGYEAEASMDIEYSFDVAPNGVQSMDDMTGSSHIVIDLSQSIGGSQSLDIMLESVLLDGQNFSRVVESATDLGVPLGEWNPTPSPPAPPPIPLDRETSEPFLLLYLVNPQTVIDIEEQAATTLNGEAVRVILLDLDPVWLRAERVIYELGMGPENETNFTASLSGVGALTTDTRYAIKVYIADDGLPRRVEYRFANTVTAEQQNAGVNQELEGVVSYTNFDAPVAIQNPLAAESGPSTFAQAMGSDLENVVTDAYTNLQSLNSYHVEGRVVGLETLTSEIGGLDLDMTVAYAYDVIPNGRAGFDDMDGTATLELNMVRGGQAQHMALLMDNVLLDETIYTFVREADVAGGLSVPVGEWVDGGAANTDIIPDDRVNSEPFLFYYLVDPLTIDTLTELPPQQRNGQPVRVFEVALDPIVLRDLGVMSATGIGEGTGFNLTASFDGMGQFTTETTYRMTIFIGEADNLPHCVEYTFNQVVTAELRNGRAEQSIEGVLEYSNFDAPLTIENPMQRTGSTGGGVPDSSLSC